MSPRSRIVLDRAELTAVVHRLGAAIEADHPDGVVMIGVLKGALVFLADLVRAVQAVDVQVDFLAISRYAPNSGRVRIVQDVQLELGGRDVVLVEDLLDTGLTCAYLLQHVQALGARRVEVCTMLDRPGRRIVPIAPRYVGATLADDAFVLGVGLHHQDRYRNLPIVLEADRDALDTDADAFVSWYGFRGPIVACPAGLSQEGRWYAPRVIQMALMGVRVEVPTNQPIVLLREEGGTRYLPIFIGPPEATAIVYALQGMDTPRPMTHDLFTTVLSEAGVVLEQVEITELHDGTFFAEITLRRGEQNFRISSRPSDAIALAVRMDHEVPILAAEAVLDEAGVLFEPEEADTDIEEFREFLDQVSPEDFAD